MKTVLLRSLQSALIVVILATIWVLFAPVQFGGTATYVIVAGASMEPSLKQGDLVIARQDSTYNIGDVTAYQHPQVGPVIHRVIAREGPYYTLQGDNNDWIDAYEPTDAEILGKSWLHLPGAAEKLLWLRTPLGLTLLSTSIGAMFLITVANKRDRHSDRDPRGQDMFSKWYRQTQSLRLGEWTFPLGIVLFASILLGAFAFTKPVFQSIPDDILYEHTGSFSYHAPSVPSLYSENEIRTGEAIFHELINTIDLSYDYTFSTDAETNLAGFAQLSLRLSEPNGWQREYLLTEKRFEGTSYTAEASVDLAQIKQYLSWVRTQTGLDRRTFDIEIMVNTLVEGTVGGQPFNETYYNNLQFKLDEIQLYLADTSPLAEESDPLRPTRTGFIPQVKIVDNVIPILGLELTVRQARRIALIAGGISLVLILFIMTPAFAVSLRSESERIKLVHAEHVLDVDEIPFNGSLEWARVADIEALIKLSEATGNLILHVRDGDEHTYSLKDGDTGYRISIHDPNGTEQLPDELENPNNPGNEPGEEA